MNKYSDFGNASLLKSF